MLDQGNGVQVSHISPLSECYSIYLSSCTISEYNVLSVCTLCIALNVLLTVQYVLVTVQHVQLTVQYVLVSVQYVLVNVEYVPVTIQYVLVTVQYVHLV